jgi:4-hydroxybenzoate polyprenyltransferase
VKTLASIGRLHIVAIAALGLVTFGWLFTGERLWLLAGFCALDWFLVNLLNRVVDLREDTANAIAGTDFVARHRGAILVSGFALLAASLLAGQFLAPRILPFRLAFHALGFAYNWPLVGGVRLKQLYFWKNCASATGFMLTVFGYPLAQAGHARISVAGVAAAALFFFLFELSYEVIYDLRDAPGDAEAGVRTYPVVHGIAAAVHIVDGLCVAACVTLIAAFVAHVVPWRLFVMIAAPAIQLVLYKRFLRRGITSADCIGLTWLGCGLLVSYHLWIAAGLPGVA